MRIIKGKEKEYKDWYDKNSDGYSRACFTYAERWAELLEAEIDKSNDVMKCFADNADRLSREADTEGITGFLCTDVQLGILSQCWEYGEYLRKWHNKKYDYDYDGDGVVNPAVMAVGVK